MPSRVPHRLFIKRLIIQLRNNVLTYLRFLLVCFIWLGLVPFCARWIWRFYFRFGDWSVESLPPPTNTTVTEPITSERGIFEDGFFGWLKGGDLWTAVLRDCFQGQIITICLVAVFVVVFLIREWVMQNAVAAVEEMPPPPLPAVAQDPIPVAVPQRDFIPRPPGLDAQAEAEGMNAFLPPRLLRDRQAGIATGVQANPDHPPHPNDVEDAIRDMLVQPEMYEVHPNPLEPPPIRREFIQPPPFPGPNAIPPAVFPPANNNWGNDIPRVRDFDVEDDLDGDEFDGLWDILGMQGPIIGLLHNTVFSALMIALAVGLGVWLPFMFGKTALGALVFCPLRTD